MGVTNRIPAKCECHASLPVPFDWLPNYNGNELPEYIITVEDESRPHSEKVGFSIIWCNTERTIALRFAHCSPGTLLVPAEGHKFAEHTIPSSLGIPIGSGVCHPEACTDALSLANEIWFNSRNSADLEMLRHLCDAITSPDDDRFLVVKGGYEP
ncbi:hypothetical protein FOL47_010483 [Perkinsus chesapeaki]|uniref:Uncharacterized protein n=1 Tax=Perkinsus chesapeaki TaxID=330153 RepID=A0A7J6L3M9_PERCH|nr:hypothetical protein FOL47_010483 [Perkinsus chesapeaki]